MLLHYGTKWLVPLVPPLLRLPPVPQNHFKTQNNKWTKMVVPLEKIENALTTDRLCFKRILMNHNSKATSDCHSLIFSKLFFFTASVSFVISVTIVGFSVFSRRVPTSLSTC